MSSLGPNAGFGGLTGRFRQHLRRGGPALVMAAVGAAIGLPHAPGGATLAFLVATLASFGTRTGLAAGALALIAGVGVAAEFRCRAGAPGVMPEWSALPG